MADNGKRRHFEASKTTKLIIFGYIRELRAVDVPLAVQLLVVCFVWEHSIVWRERLHMIRVNRWPPSWFEMWETEIRAGYYAPQLRGCFVLDLYAQQYDAYRWIFAVTMPEIAYCNRGDYPHSIPIKIGLTYAEPRKRGETYIWYYLALQTVRKNGRKFAKISANTNVCFETNLEFDQYAAVPFPKLRVAMSFSRIMNGLLFEIWTQQNDIVGSIGYLSWGDMSRRFKVGVGKPTTANVKLLRFEVNDL